MPSDSHRETSKPRKSNAHSDSLLFPAATSPQSKGVVQNKGFTGIYTSCSGDDNRHSIPIRKGVIRIILLFCRPDRADTSARSANMFNFVGWEKDHALFDREMDKVIRALRTDEGSREKPPPARL